MRRGYGITAAVLQFRTYKIIYRRYAGLFFSFCVDVTDNELSLLEGIHLFVEMLDRFFGNGEWSERPCKTRKRSHSPAPSPPPQCASLTSCSTFTRCERR